MNLYAYVGNDPINMIDPTGKTGESARARRGQIVAEALAEVSKRTLGKESSVTKTLESTAKRAEKSNADWKKAHEVVTNPKVDKVVNAISENGYKVTINPKNEATKQEATKQEVNATIDFGDKTKVNLRVESHPLTQGGPNVRHANVEVMKKVKNKNRVVSNQHIIDEN